MNDVRKPHLELVRQPSPTLDELGERIDTLCREIDEHNKAIHLRVARLESMFPRGTRGPREAA